MVDPPEAESGPVLQQITPYMSASIRQSPNLSVCFQVDAQRYLNRKWLSTAHRFTWSIQPCYSSVARTTACTPGDSSARFLTLERCAPESSRISLPLAPTRVMDVSTAKERQRRIMATFTIDSDNNISALAGLPAGADESQSFSSAKELAKLTAEWPISRLVDTWNSLRAWRPSMI
jgi:hypothetical protein